MVAAAVVTTTPEKVVEAHFHDMKATEASVDSIHSPLPIVRSAIDIQIAWARAVHRAAIDSTAAAVEVVAEAEAATQAAAGDNMVAVSRAATQVAVMPAAVSVEVAIIDLDHRLTTLGTYDRFVFEFV